MGQHYDVIVIGGGHNGLVNAAYLAKAGKKVVVSSAVTFSGARPSQKRLSRLSFSECSYVVSLLRPEIIRELDLPRHGLEILPSTALSLPCPAVTTSGASTTTPNPFAIFGGTLASTPRPTTSSPR